MSTEAWIAKVDRDGNGRSIELWTDGYPGWAGALLLLHYSEEEQIDRLLDLGTLQDLGPSPDHHPMTYIDRYGKRDTLGYHTRAYSREGDDDSLRWLPRPVSGGTDGLCSRDGWHPFTYVWTPDGWFATYPSYMDGGGQFVGLLDMIHDNHRRRYLECQVAEPAERFGYSLMCAKHSGHSIGLLQTILPEELLPSDPDHPTHRLACAFPPWARTQQPPFLHDGRCIPYNRQNPA